MIMGEMFNGYTNKETHDASLWIDHDAARYGQACEIAMSARVLSDQEIGRRVESWFTDWLDRDNHTVEEFFADMGPYEALKDIGSLWRVNWTELALTLIKGEDRGCWHAGSNRPGFLPEVTPGCYLTREDAVSVLTSDMEEWADTADDAFEELIDTTVPEDELNGCDQPSTRALVDSIVSDGDLDPSGKGDISLTLPDDNGNQMAFWATYVPYGKCSHDGCEHED
jgi:hypothetical protein